jgi:hypothetical protein
MKVFAILTIISMLFWAGDGSFKTIKTYSAPEAKQAVAADGKYFYAIDDALVAKYDLQGKKVAEWQPKPDSHIKHLNSGFVKDGLLYMAHSNYPAIPRLSTIEILDTKTMEHYRTLEFGAFDGAANIVVWRNNAWWVLFAHYGGDKAEPGRTSADTRLDRFNIGWERTESYTLPKELIEKIQSKSISGGAFGPDGQLYLTGHDAAEVYLVRFPKEGNVLEYVQTYPVACEGQGIAWHGNQLYTIKRSTREVIVSEWVAE